MKKLIALALGTVVLYANEYKPIEYTIKSNITQLTQEIPNNHTGVVVKQLGQNNKAIVAIARANNGLIDYLPNTLLEQENLPSVNEKVSAGDKIIFNYLYSNAVIIAPNLETYKSVEEKFTSTTFIDIDTLSGYLTRETEPKPQKSDFLAYAREYDIGLFYFAIDGRLYAVDARTLNIIDSKNFRVALDEPQSPFYSKVKEIKGSFWDWFGDKNIGDYNTYYKKLLGI